jgi:DNA-binding MarR family transcriptional regulator
VNDDEVTRLGNFAELILALARQLPPPTEVAQTGTAVESSVMRFVARNPGSTARAASEATLLPSSNFSRVLRALETKGYVRREADERDARVVRLYPTEFARENLQQLRAAWSRTLQGTVDNPETVEFICETLRRIENELVARRRRTGDPANESHA